MTGNSRQVIPGREMALRAVTDACQILWQSYLHVPDACVMVQFASWLSAKQNIENTTRIHTREVIKNALSTATFEMCALL